MATKILSVTGPINDNFLYCEDCNQEFDGDCPKHGPLLAVNDAEVPENCPRGSDLGYSRATLPEGLVIKKSRIPKAGLGVFALKDFPTRSRFGPYQGREENSDEVAQESGYCWQVLKNGKHFHYLDGKKPSESNWMRFVNCARSEDEQCVTAYQYKGEIFFRAHRHIFAGNEILVYYGDSYAKDLGIRTQRVGNFSRRALNTEEMNKAGLCDEDNNMHFCSPCYAAFSKLDGLQKHIAKLTEEKKLADEVYKHKKSADSITTQNESTVAIQTVEWSSNANKVVCVFQKEWKLYVNEKGCKICFHTDLSSRKEAEESAYNCDVCGAEFNSSGYLQTNRIHSSGEKPFKCSICDLSFFRSGNLEAHKRKHTGEKPYKCDICDERFSDRGSLLRHKNKHTADKPYKCDTCGARFASSEDLVTHKTEHTGEKAYKCNVCDVGFVTRHELLRHERVHTGDKSYKCDVCGLGFTHSADLQIHERRHTKEKPFKCDICGVEFAQSSNLLAHKRAHTGEKPYKCDECDESFAQCVSLSAHKRTHAAEKPT